MTSSSATVLPSLFRFSATFLPLQFDAWRRCDADEDDAARTKRSRTRALRRTRKGTRTKREEKEKVREKGDNRDKVKSATSSTGSPGFRIARPSLARDGRGRGGQGKGRGIGQGVRQRGMKWKTKQGKNRRRSRALFCVFRDRRPGSPKWTNRAKRHRIGEDEEEDEEAGENRHEVEEASDKDKEKAR